MATWRYLTDGQYGTIKTIAMLALLVGLGRAVTIVAGTTTTTS